MLVVPPFDESCQAERLFSSTTIALFLAAETSPHDLAQLETLKSDEYPGDKRSQEPDLEASCKIRSSAQIGGDYRSGMGRSSHCQSQVSIVGNARCGWWYATKKVGTNHQPVFSRRTDGRGCRYPLRRVQGRDYRADALLRLIIRSRWN